MFSSQFTVPTLALVSASFISISAYLIAPEIGRRHLNASGAVQYCENLIVKISDLERELSEAEKTSRLSPSIDVGQILGAVVGDRPDLGEFISRYSKRYEDIGKALSRPVTAVLEIKRESAERRSQAIETRFKESAAVGETPCACKARTVINHGRINLAIFTATGGFVTLPPADDWASALSAPDIAEQCQRGLP